jgi:hypothetical protein
MIETVSLVNSRSVLHKEREAQAFGREAEPERG